jgi:A nuclease family of the HNH/ENDO VII superfamily with conserved AHH
MGSQTSHSEGVEKGKFCALRRDKCPCGNKYQENGKPPTSWAQYFFWQGSKVGVDKKHEAHHLICIASVTEFIGKNATIERIVEQTEWCVNAKKNMFGMPLWGHTIQWYVFDDKGRAPPFKNIPQHDYDHNSTGGYIDEVDKKMQRIADTITEQAKKSHKAAVAELVTRLNNMSGSLLDTLKERGMRCDGTHEAWKKGAKQPKSDWYKPFSMASDAIAERRTFPVENYDSKVADKIERLRKALFKWG